MFLLDGHRDETCIAVATHEFAVEDDIGMMPMASLTDHVLKAL